MKDYKLRLSKTWMDCSGIIHKIAEQCDQLVVYEHSADCTRPHIHAYIGGLRRSYDTILGWMKTACPLKSDRTLGSTYGKPPQPVDISFISYMSKGRYDPCFVQGVTEDIIAHYKSLGYYKEDTNDMIDVELVNGRMVKQVSPAKKLQIQLLEEMRSELGEVDYNSLSDESIYKAIRKVCMHNKYFLPRGLYKLMEFRDNLLLYGNSQHALNEFAIAIARRQRM